MTRVKICGITNLDDALLSATLGADALGFNFYDGSPRYIEPAKAQEICFRLPDKTMKVGVFVNETVTRITEIVTMSGLDAVQLHGDETPEFVRELRSYRNSFSIVKALRVTRSFRPEEASQYDSDSILLDAFTVGERGGTGETFDWEIASMVAQMVPQLYLAGGLNQENVVEAIETVRPYAVDVCSGVESSKGKKDAKKLEAFVSNVRNAG